MKSPEVLTFCNSKKWRHLNKKAFVKASLCWGHFKQTQHGFGMLFWAAMTESHPLKNIFPFLQVEWDLFLWVFCFFCIVQPRFLLFFFFSSWPGCCLVSPFLFLLRGWVDLPSGAWHALLSFTAFCLNTNKSHAFLICWHFQLVWDNLGNMSKCVLQYLEWCC